MFNIHVTIRNVYLEYFNHKTVIVKIALERPDKSLTGYKMRASLGLGETVAADGGWCEANIEAVMRPLRSPESGPASTRGCVTLLQLSASASGSWPP